MEIWRGEGLRGIMRGLELTTMRDTIGMSCFFVTFQIVKSLLVKEETFHSHNAGVVQWIKDKKDAVLHRPDDPHDADHDSFVHRELGWSGVHVWNSFSIVIAGICAGLSYRVLTHPFVVLQHRRDRDYLIKLNDHHRFSTARVPLLCFAHTATGQHYPHPPAWVELLQLYRKDGLKFLKLDPSSTMSAFGFPHSIPSFLNRLTLLFSPSVVGLLTYELTKMHQQQEVHQH